MNRVKLFYCCFLALGCSAAYGQGFTGGLKGGFDLSQIDGDKMAGYHKGGLIFGGFINRELNTKLNWQMEMIYIAKGSKKGINPDKNQFEYRRIAVNYIEVPILLQIWSKKLKTHFETGLSFATLVNSKEEDGDGETTFIGPFKRIEFGYLLGLNYKFSDQLSGTARFSYSISPIAEGNRVKFIAWELFGGSYNNVLEFTLNYHLNTKD